MTASRTVVIKKTELDEDFRREVRKLIDSAKKEIVIITGEIAAFGYQDLRWAAERAVERGVKIKIFATSPVPEYLNRILMLGCDVYLGKDRVKDHFLVVDGKNWTISKGHPPLEIGMRSGVAHLNDEKGSRKILNRFEQLVRRAEKIDALKLDLDPLAQMIEKPRSWGTKTNARKFRKELFG